MAISQDMFWKYNEARANAGYKSAWLVKLPENGGKYSLIGLSNSVPYPFGDTETFDVNVLQSRTIGKVEGKITMESVDVPVYHHRDNAYRYNKLAGQVLEFMSINSEFVGYKYSGTLKYKPNTAEGDVGMATVALTPIAGSEEPVYDVRSEIIDTLCFKGVIPETVNTDTTVDFGVVQNNVTLAFDIKKIASGTNAEGLATADDYTTSGNTIKFKTAGLFAITAKDSSNTCASWTTTVYVNPKN